MFRFLQIAVPILVVADFLVRWRKGLLDWFSVALLIGVALLLIGSFVDGPAGEWLAAAAGIIFLGRSAVAYFLVKRDRKLQSINNNKCVNNLQSSYATTNQRPLTCISATAPF
jgi:hypothetical protein